MKPMFKSAKAAQTKIRLNVQGPPGSGKTYGALLLACGLARPTGRIGVIDTERGRSNAYERPSDENEIPRARAAAIAAGVPVFEVAELETFTPTAYLEALDSAEAQGFDVVIVDSTSHEWSTVLEQVDALQASGKNKLAAWKGPSMEHQRFMQKIVQFRTHIICTTRTKVAHELVDNGRGGKDVVKLGLAPQAREGTEYEFDVVFDVAQNHLVTLSKANTSYAGALRLALARETAPKLSVALGARLREWIESTPAPTKPAPAAPPTSTPERDELVAELMTLAVDLDRAGSPKGPELVAKLNGGALANASVGALRTLAEKARGYLADTKTAGAPAPSGSPAPGALTPVANKPPAPDPSLEGAQAGGAVDPKRVTVVLDDGSVVTGRTSHFATCPAADQFRRREGASS